MPRTTHKTGTLGRIAIATLVKVHACVLVAGLAAPLLAPAPARAQTTATVMADQVYVDGSGRLVASGAVEIWQGSVRVTAERVMFDRVSDALDIQGPITISDGPDQVVMADAAQLSPNLRAGLVTSARVVLNQQLQIAAARIEAGVNGVSQMEAVVASSCPVCASDPTPLWEIRADRVIHDDNTGRIQFQRAQFRFAGVPILYAPRLNLPAPGTTRLRGMLRPEVSLDSDLGLQAGIPYFIPFGDTSDLTLTPRASSRGMVSLGFRYRLARQNGGIEMGGQISRDELLPGRTRGYGYVRALFHLANDWVLSADVLAASERSYLETYDITSEARLRGHVTLERIRRDQAVRARFLGFYSMRLADDNDTLPNAATQVDAEHHHSLAGGDLTLGMGATAFVRHSSLDGVQGRDVARAHVRLSWRRSAILPGGIVATGALAGRFDHVRVDDDSAYPDPLNRQAAQAMVELRWPWATTTDSGARHVIEPVMQVIDSRRNGVTLPNDDNTMPELDAGNLFALTRSSAEGAPDDGARINAGLRWARQDASSWSTEALVGRIWRRDTLAGFDPAHVQPLGGARSDWLLAGRLSHSDGYALTLRMLLDDDANVTRAETNFAWAGDRTEVSTSYLYLPASSFEARTVTLSEWSLDVKHELNNGWRTTVGWDYDVAQSIFAAARTGLAYSNECLAVNLTLARHFVTATNPSASTRFNMRVELLGIGGRAPNSSGRTCRA
ncbi:LPS-assembly protein LptD [Pararhodobacter zhoushanensis]|uniref:LPS-assembly protein LptD n=1 Tax=Pararhodobacter zhoushanensis TaxID=2479545 RepID=A0ABT3H1H9_9RHOB|nr:LPS assembly protein LptD [Pararhodobacter zhoushanensis]MCW1933553.1 LPS assembly protein LptD [Pararhodobacter zhoushanensis]